MRLGIQGTRGSYSDEAARLLLPEASVSGYATVEEARAALVREDVEALLLPVENSTAGSVTDVVDLLRRDDGLCVFQEAHLRVRHQLLALPGARPAYALSHPQALAQCRQFLVQRGIEPRPYYDTAAAAAYVAEHGVMDGAAIAGRQAAQHFGLEILAEDIHDQEGNTTRFLLLRRQAPSYSGQRAAVVFGVPQRVGTLVDALMPFKQAGINMTKIESRPAGAFAYWFHVEFETKGEASVRRVLDLLADKVSDLVFLGAYDTRLLN